MAAYSIIEDLCSENGLRLTFNYLLPVVRANSTITYGEIADRLRRDLKIKGKVNPRHIGWVADALITRMLKIDDSAPLINVLIVDQITRQPSTGADSYLRKRFDLRGPIGEHRRLILVEREAKKIYTYKGWPSIYRRIFKQNAPAADPTSLVNGTERDGMPPASSNRHYGGPAESDEHKKLKYYVVNHPACIGVTGKPRRAEVEYRLPSGDEVDGFIENDTAAYLIEVKSVRSTEPDFLRGVYQCIKYRAVFRAERVLTPNLRIKAILVTENEPLPKILYLAKQHDVKLVVVPVNR